MDNITQSIRNQRRPKGKITPIGITFLHLRHPLVPAAWSVIFPGFGHILLNNYLKGYILIVWEIFINLHAKINLAIFYSFTGQFELAKNVLDKRWVLLYISVYVYAIWSSHRLSVEINKYSILADREKSPIIPMKISAAGINFLDKKNPWLSTIGSALMPGTGQTYNHELFTGFFVLAWWITIIYFSHLLEAIHLSAFGAFKQAAAITDPQWILFLPSIYLFAIYEAYVVTVELNKLYGIEQSRFLENNYQNPSFEMPV